MNPVIEYFFAGLAFGMGVTSWFFVGNLMTSKGRARIQKDFNDHAKRVEDRIATQVSAMVACLEAIEKQNAEDKKGGAR